MSSSGEIDKILLFIFWSESGKKLPWEEFHPGGFYSKVVSWDEAKVLMNSGTIRLRESSGPMGCVDFSVRHSITEIRNGKQEVWIYTHTKRHAHEHTSWDRCLSENGFFSGSGARLYLQDEHVQTKAA